VLLSTLCRQPDAGMALSDEDHRLGAGDLQRLIVNIINVQCADMARDCTGRHGLPSLTGTTGLLSTKLTAKSCNSSQALRSERSA
jgi:hypothetical protein